MQTLRGLPSTNFAAGKTTQTKGVAVPRRIAAFLRRLLGSHSRLSLESGNRRRELQMLPKLLTTLISKPVIFSDFA